MAVSLYAVKRIAKMSSTPCGSETLRAQLQIPASDSLSLFADMINVAFLEPMHANVQSIDPSTF